MAPDEVPKVGCRVDLAKFGCGTLQVVCWSHLMAPTTVTLQGGKWRYGLVLHYTGAHSERASSLTLQWTISSDIRCDTQHSHLGPALGRKISLLCTDKHSLNENVSIQENSGLWPRSYGGKPLCDCNSLVNAVPQSALCKNAYFQSKLWLKLSGWLLFQKGNVMQELERASNPHLLIYLHSFLSRAK